MPGSRVRGPPPLGIAPCQSSVSSPPWVDPRRTLTALTETKLTKPKQFTTKRNTKQCIL